MRILICPDKFKGSATATEVADALAHGIEFETAHDHQIDKVLVADGGEGTLAVLANVPGSTMFHAVVSGPLGTPVNASWALLADGTAVVEMAQASGLALVEGPLQPLEATTFGTGELIALAAAAGASRCIIGVGGSATTDGGVGALDALGWSLHGMDVVVATDVVTTFVDAARVFGPQKGATPAEVDTLVERLEILAQRYAHDYSVDVRSVERSGAAGGLAGGLFALGARLVSGFDLVADVVDLQAAIERADLVITGEGRADDTSFVGKPVGGVWQLATAHGIPVIVVCGQSALSESESRRFHSVYQLAEVAPTVQAAVTDPLPFLRTIGAQIGAALRAATPG
jgi:glycerate 2-kinase